MEEDEDAGKVSDADYRSEDKDSQDGEEVAPTCKDWEDDLPNIPSSEPAGSKANPSGSGDLTSKKRSPTLVRSASVESIHDPKRRKVMEDIMGALLSKIWPDESKMIHLGHAAWKLAKQVFHATTLMWTTKECNAFMAKYLQLVPKQKKEFKADLQKEDFFKEYEKMPGYQAAFDYMRKMQASARSHRIGMIPLFYLADTLMKTTEETRNALDGCRAVVVPDDDLEASFTGWGQELVPALLKPLLDLRTWSVENMKLDDLGMTDEQIAIVRERC